MIEAAITKRACVPYDAIVVRVRQEAETNILPAGRESPRKRIACDVEGRVAYFFAIIRHTSPVFSICVFWATAK